MKNIAVLCALSALLLSGCQATESSGQATPWDASCEGVGVAVDFGLLADSSPAQCVTLTEDSAIASEVLQSAGVETEGTETYGDLVICRVNGLPAEETPFEVPGEDPHQETCADMPPAFAYWALWVKRSGDTEWAYAEAGVADLQLAPGDALGLVFSTGGETPTPVLP